MNKNNRAFYCFLSILIIVYGICFNHALAFFSDNIKVDIKLVLGKRPIISEVSQPKTFFVSQSGDIDLTKYATAWDELDGDLTHKITISAPDFEEGLAGVFDIKYSVKNSIGLESSQIVTITVWDFIKIVSGDYHTLALTSHGRVYSWGANYYGQLGDGSNMQSTSPFHIAVLDGIVDIAAGGNSSYALDSSGQIYSWGDNRLGQLGDGSTTERRTPIQVQQSGVGFKKITSGISTVAAIAFDGSVYTWGEGAQGGLGNGKTGNVPVPTKINVENAVSVAIGQVHGAAITQNGELYTWGNNGYGSLGIGSGAGIATPIKVSFFDDIRVASISVGRLHMAAISEDERLFTWGYGGYGALGMGDKVGKNIPTQIALPSAAIKVVAGFDYTGVILDDGRVGFFGQNDYGKMGLGTSNEQLTPKFLESPTGISDLALGTNSTIIMQGGAVGYGMGYGEAGSLGTGNSSNSLIPARWAFLPPPPY